MLKVHPVVNVVMTRKKCLTKVFLVPSENSREGKRNDLVFTVELGEAWTP